MKKAGKKWSTMRNPLKKNSSADVPVSKNVDVLSKFCVPCSPSILSRETIWNRIRTMSTKCSRRSSNGVNPRQRCDPCIYPFLSQMSSLFIYISRLFLFDEKKRTADLRSIHRRKSSFIEPVIAHWKNTGLEYCQEDRRPLHHTTNCRLQIELVPRRFLAMIARLIEWSSRYLVSHHSHTCIVWILSSISSPFCFLINESRFFSLSNESEMRFYLSIRIETSPNRFHLRYVHRIDEVQVNCVLVFDGEPSVRRDFERWQIVQDSTPTAQRYAIDEHRWLLPECSFQSAHCLLPQQTRLVPHVKINRSVLSSRKSLTRYSRRVTRGVSSVHARVVRIVNYWHVEWCEYALRRQRRMCSYSFSCTTRFWLVIDFLLHKVSHDTCAIIRNSSFFVDLMEHGLPICTPIITSPERALVNLTRIHQYAALKKRCVTHHKYQ